MKISLRYSGRDPKSVMGGLSCGERSHGQPSISWNKNSSFKSTPETRSSHTCIRDGATGSKATQRKIESQEKKRIQVILL